MKRNKKRKAGPVRPGRQDGHAAHVHREDAREKSWSARWGFITVGIIVVVGACWAMYRSNRSLGPAAPPAILSTTSAPTTLAATDADTNISLLAASAPNTNRDTNASIRVPDPATLEDKAQAMTWGTEFLLRGHLSNGVAFYERALQLDPEDEEVHFNLAYAYSRQHRTNDAIHHYSEALKIFPDYVEAHNNLGNLLVTRRQFDEAIGHFSSALKLQPENASTLNNLGKCLAVQGRAQEAVAYFSDALRVNADYVEARFNLANALLALGRGLDAVVEFQAVLQARPDFPPALQGLDRARKLAGVSKKP
jgi:tetratricopeptide (TPR) repeat protein